MLFIHFSRWPRLYLLLEEDHQQNCKANQWLPAVQQRVKLVSKVGKELSSMSAISYPHGQPPLALIESLVSSSIDFDFIEDELLDIIFHHKKYKHHDFQFSFSVFQKCFHFTDKRILHSSTMGAKCFIS